MASDVSLAFNAVGRDRGVNALLTRTASNVRASNLASAASTVAMGAAMASAGSYAVALASSMMTAAGAAAAVPAALAAGAATIGALRAVTFGLGDAWKATGQAATGGGGKVGHAADQSVMAARAVRNATEALADAKRDEQAAIQAVNRARAEEAERLEDLSRSLSGARLAEETATRAVEKAEQDLAVARAGGSNYEIEEADLAYRQAQQTLEETKDRVGDLSKEQADGAKKGVEGSDAVQDALERQREAHRQVQRAAEQLADAQREVGTASAGAVSGGIDPSAQALAKLSPNGRATILMLRQLAPAWRGAFNAGQQATFAGVPGILQRLSGTYLPIATTWLTRMGGAFNTAIRQSAGLVTSQGFVRDTGTFLNNTALSAERLARGVRPIINGFMQWIAVGSGFLPGLASDATTLAQRFEQWSIKMRESGRAASWIRNGIGTLRQFGAIARDVFMTVVAVLRAGGDGGSTVTALTRGAAAMRRWVESAQGQAKIRQIFQALRGVLGAVGPLIASVAGHGDELGESMTVLGQSASFAINHLGPLVKYLPTLAAGYLLLKHTGISAGVGLGVKAFQIASQFAMSRAIKAHTAALRENTVASRTSAASTATDTAAQNGGVLARGRAVVATIAQRTATIAATVATRAAAAGQWLLNAAMSANPLGLIIIAIVAVAAGLYLLWTRSATFRRIVTGAWSAVWGAIKAVWNWIKDNWPKIVGFLTLPYRTAWTAIKKAYGWVKDGAKAAKTYVTDRFGDLVTWFRNLPSRIGRALGSVARFLTAPFRLAFNGVASLWNRTVGGFSFTIPSWIPGIGGNSFALPKIPRLAQGGIVPATAGGRLVTVAEAGEDEVVAPLSKLGQVAAAAGGGVARVVIDLRGADGEFKRFFRKLMRADNVLQMEG